MSYLPLVFGPEEMPLEWAFDNQEPRIRYGGRQPQGRYYSRSITVDPFPCYSHSISLVKEWAQRVYASFPIDRVTYIFILQNETKDRINGWTGLEWDWDSKIWSPEILLMGKRIPLHPGMTRYLVTHEYGHVVEKFIRTAHEDLNTQNAHSKVLEDYGKMRGMDKIEPNYYGGRTWHSSVGELFANDFRILVANAETEYWPHPGFARPEDLPGVIDFWAQALKLKYDPQPQTNAVPTPA